MSYRDDREALHGRIAQLEQELRDARHAGRKEGREEAEARAQELEGRVREMKAELDELRGKKPAAKKTTSLAMAALMFVIALAVGIAIAIATRRATPPRPTPAPFPRTATPTSRTPTPQTRQTTKVQWKGKVTKAEGMRLLPSTPCTVTATVIMTGSSAPDVEDLSVQCQGQALYRSTDALAGISMTSAEVGVIHEGAFALSYRDVGERTGERAQVDLDTKAGQGRAFRDMIPRYRVEFSLQPTSVPDEPAAASQSPIPTHYTVASVFGRAPTKPGVACKVHVTPSKSTPSSCALEITCGTAVVWPAKSPVKCEQKDNHAISLEWDGGDDTRISTGADQTIDVHTKMWGVSLAVGL